MAEQPGSEEVVLDLGVEGGGLTIYRARSEAGTWVYYKRTSSIWFDDDDNEAWQYRASEPAPSFEELLGTEWAWFTPISVHPEYRQSVWDLVQDRARVLEDEELRMWDRKKHRWQALCGQ